MPKSGENYRKGYNRRLELAKKKAFPHRCRFPCYAEEKTAQPLPSSCSPHGRLLWDEVRGEHSVTNAGEGADVTTEQLLGLQGSKQGFLGDLSAALWCCEGIAQHRGRHVGITKLRPCGGGIGAAHPPCVPEQTVQMSPKSCLSRRVIQRRESILQSVSG